MKFNIFIGCLAVVAVLVASCEHVRGVTDGLFRGKL